MTIDAAMLNDARPEARPSKGLIWAGRILTALPIPLFAFSAISKLSAQASMVEGFGKLGIPIELMPGIGVLELLVVALYLVPRTAVLGAVLVTGYLGGAIMTHLRAGEPFVMPLIIGVIVWGGLWLREPRVRKLLPIRLEG